MKRLTLLLSLLLCLGLSAAALADGGALLRYADVHGDRVVFTFEGDLWVARTDGSPASRITRHDGEEVWAKFSPDGTKIAFTGSYDGGSDVYIMDAEGGVPVRLTFHPDRDYVLGWFPDGKHILFRSTRETPGHFKIFKVSMDGGMPEALPVDEAGLTAISPDGKSIAYNRITREQRTWKMYQGGMAQNIWMGSLETGDFRPVTDWKGTDNFPMWEGGAVYFTSDREYGTLNLYKYDVSTKQTTPLTAYRDYDVKYPSIGPGAIVYQYADTLHLFDLASGRDRQLSIPVHSDRVPVRESFADSEADHGRFGLNPDGSRLLIEVRGEIANLPAEEGEAFVLTDNSASREKGAAWSPDGKWVALISDKTGEEEIYLLNPEGKGEWKQVTRDGSGFRAKLTWSPDSKNLLFSDKAMRLNLLDVEKAATKVIDRGDYDDGWYRWGIQDFSWSPCGRWVAYSKLEGSGYESIFLYSLDTGETTRVTCMMTPDWSPSFDPHGRYLYFLSQRSLSPIMGSIDQNHIFLDTTRPYLVILKNGELSPFAPGFEAGEPEEVKPGKAISIDLEGIGDRIVAAEGVEPGNYFRLEGADKGFLYVAKTEPEFLKYQYVDDTTQDPVALYAYDLSEEETSEVLSGISNYHLSADGKKLVYRAKSSYGIVDAGSKAKAGDGKVSLEGVIFKIDREAEFLQIFDEAWRIQRDWFYDPDMHGVDWAAIGEKYRKLVPGCGTRSDLNYVIGEMIGELNVGHSYIFGGDMGDGPDRISTGLLGAEFDAPEGSGYYRFAHIIPGTSWDPSEASPLAAPGSPVKEGDYLIAIDGDEVTSSENVYEFLENKAGKEITITFNSEPTAQGARDFRMKTLRSESGIRYREWVNKNFAKVWKDSDGEIGYVHIPGMMEDGLVEFARYFYPQHDKRALIIDVRDNGGGFVSGMIVDRLEREIWGMTQPREGLPNRDPERVFHGPIIVLINEHTGSDGENFAEAMKVKGLGTVMGMRTWGGSVGIEPHQDMVDGGGTTPPQFGAYGLDNKWIIEGVGVVPQIEVQNWPVDVLRGKDAQLEAAVAEAKKQLAENPPKFPEKPPYPVRGRTSFGGQ